VVICLGRGAYLHMAQLMPLPLTVSCFSKIQISFTFLVLAHPDGRRQNPEGYKMVVGSSSDSGSGRRRRHQLKATLDVC